MISVISVKVVTKDASANKDGTLISKILRCQTDRSASSGKRAS